MANELNGTIIYDFPSGVSHSIVPPLSEPIYQNLNPVDPTLNYPVIRGEKGEKGEPGIDGTASSRFEFSQPITSSTWIVNHNLGFRPNVLAWSVGGMQMLAEVIHVSLNQTNLYFDNPVAGFATCS